MSHSAFLSCGHGRQNLRGQTHASTAMRDTGSPSFDEDGGMCVSVCVQDRTGASGLLS